MQITLSPDENENLRFSDEHVNEGFIDVTIEYGDKLVGVTVSLIELEAAIDAFTGKRWENQRAAQDKD